MTFPERLEPRIAEIAEAIEAGLSQQEALTALGISRATLYRYTKRIGRQFSRRTQNTPRHNKIVQAIANGVETSPNLALLFGMSRPQMSVELTRLADRGLIESKLSAPTKRGRPCLRWRIVKKEGRK